MCTYIGPLHGSCHLYLPVISTIWQTWRQAQGNASLPFSIIFELLESIWKTSSYCRYNICWFVVWYSVWHYKLRKYLDYAYATVLIEIGYLIVWRWQDRKGRWYKESGEWRRKKVGMPIINRLILQIFMHWGILCVRNNCLKGSWFWRNCMMYVCSFTWTNMKGYPLWNHRPVMYHFFVFLIANMAHMAALCRI